MCDFCGKDITKDGYNHFSGPGPGGMGNSKKCPTHDNTEQRRKAQVDQAQAEAIKIAREENPDLTEEQLKLKFSKEVELESSWAVDPLHGMPRPRMPNLDALPQDIRQRIQHRYANQFNFGNAPQMPGAFPQQIPHPIPQPYQQHMPAINNAAIPQPQLGYVPQHQHPLPQHPAYHGGFGLGNPSAQPPPGAQLTALQRQYQEHRQQQLLRNMAILDQQIVTGNQAEAAAAGNRQHLDHPMPDYHQSRFEMRGAVPGGADRHAGRHAFDMTGLGGIVPPRMAGPRAGDAGYYWNLGGENAGEGRQRR